VLKPVEHEAEHHWVAAVFSSWPAADRIRVPVPVAARSGDLVYDGWAAHHWVDGRDASMREEPGPIRRVCEDFHAVIADLERPAFLDERDDPWPLSAMHRELALHMDGAYEVNRTRLDHLIWAFRAASAFLVLEVAAGVVNIATVI